MAIKNYLEEYAGLPVAVFDVEAAETAPGERDLPPAGEAAWRVTADEMDDPDFVELFPQFVDAVDTTEITALIIGCWGVDDLPVKVLTDAAASFPKLTSLFVGDIIMQERELSWILHGDLTPVLRAFPGLERLDVRGAEQLVLSPFRSESLRVLRFESAGLRAEVVRAVAASELPNLEHLDLWLGTGERGGDATVEDLAPVLDGTRFPSLRHLGLQNSPILDDLAGTVASAPVVARLESLALALGVLTDRGAEALLSGQPLTHLRRLDLHHHYLTDAMAGRVRAALPGVDLDLAPSPSIAHWSEEENPEFYVAIPE